MADAAQTANVIELNGISKDYSKEGNRPVLCDLELSVAAGEALAILGPSGAGKSTLLNILGLLDRADRGNYLLGGEDLALASDRVRSKRRAETIGFVFQSFHLMGRLSAVANVELGLSYRGVARADRAGRARAALQAVGLEDQIEQQASTLSGGQQQRVAIARALARRPRLLLCDEPTGNLDRNTAQTGLDLLRGVRAEGVAVVIITHDEEVAHQQDRVLRLKSGRLTNGDR